MRSRSDVEYFIKRNRERLVRAHKEMLEPTPEPLSELEAKIEKLANEYVALNAELESFSACECVDEEPFCSWCVERYKAVYEAEIASAPSAGQQASWLGYCEPGDRLVSEKEDCDSGRWQMVYNFQNQDGEYFHVKVDQDGGEECGEGEWS